MADRTEQAERAASALFRTGISLVIPVWALVMIALGLEYRSLWWLGTGVAVGAVGLLLFVGNPIASAALDARESWRSEPKAKVGGPPP
ncbi:MAG TPA: hypothetical protein VMT58_06145, partial [Candidatus Binataceae bacterium]|nr:hypothetical protein [Candidatus Binataceae bacterium]